MDELAPYDYGLPRQLIAQSPAACRSDARLLVVRRAAGSLEHRHVRDLPEVLSPGDCLVLNDTRVIPARLVGHRDRTGGRWEGLFLEANPEGVWRLLCRTRGKLVAGETITLTGPHGHEDACLVLAAKQPDGSWIARPEPPDDALSLLDRIGRVPLPPYIRKGEMVEADRLHYQTVYARQPGAVAAPTAGLHFTGSLLQRLQDLGVCSCRLTLHVGPGTFRPITAHSLADHRMHSEWGQINPECVRQITTSRQQGGRAVAVGTTSVRLLETAAATGTLEPFTGLTDLFIRPPYSFRAVDVLLTNFHLPRTTLLVLACTFGGRDLILHAYHEAIREEYRFYSYGDAMLIL